MNLIHTIGFVIRTYKTGILIGSGIACGTFCVVSTGMQTVKACDIIENANHDMDVIENSDITDEEKEKELKTIRKNTNISLVKTYIAPAALGVASIVCLLAAYKILSAQKAAAMAALSATSAAFEEYRSRVIDKFGSEVDYELYTGNITKTEVNPETGKEEVVEHKLEPISESTFDLIFAFYTSKEWEKSPRRNAIFLKGQENLLDERLQNKGYIYMWEIAEALGIDTKVNGCMTNKFMEDWGFVAECNLPEEYIGKRPTHLKFAPDTKQLTLTDTMYGDDAYILHFACYPINSILEMKSARVMEH